MPGESSRGEGCQHTAKQEEMRRRVMLRGAARLLPRLKISHTKIWIHPVEARGLLSSNEALLERNAREVYPDQGGDEK